MNTNNRNKAIKIFFKSLAFSAEYWSTAPAKTTI